MYSSSLKENFILTIITLVSMAGVASLQIPQLEKIQNKSGTLSPEALEREVELTKVNLEALEQMPSLGFDNLVADWTFTEFLEYFGDDEARDITGYSLSPEYFEIIVDRDPRFLDAYLHLSASTSLFAAKPERAVELMAKGLQSLSPENQRRAYYVWRYKATDELLFLGDTEAALQSYLKAAEWASMYTDEESEIIARISQQSAKHLASNPESKVARVNAWGLVLGNAVDEKTRERAIQEIENLGGQVKISAEGEIQGIIAPQED